MSADSPRRRWRPTREGAALLLLTVGLGLAAAITGNNVLVLLFAGLIALWVVDAVLGPWNLRHLTVRRELPAEMFADTAGRGGFQLINGRRWLPSAGLLIADSGGRAAAAVERLGAGEEAVARTAWTFGARGEASFDTITVRSSFPLGLWWREKRFSIPAAITVYPRPRLSEPRVEGGLAGAQGADPAGRGAIGDFDGLQLYREGDPPRRIHWPTTARVGTPIVVLRTDERADRVTVRVRDLSGRAWENELSRACGEVLRGFRRGCRVGLELPTGALAAQGGAAWRRTLLEALAGQPERGER